MMMNTIMIMMFLVNLILLFMFHPLAMIFILILQTILISMMLYSMMQFPWFSYTLILVFLGGMLILFTYMSNIASNEMFKPNLKMFLPMLIVPLITLVMTLPKQNLSMEVKSMFNTSYSNMMVLKPFSWSIMPVTLLMGLYIILTLLTVVKISKMNRGPLRMI